MNTRSILKVLRWLEARLSGKKTYLVAALGILYIFGGDQGWWVVNPSLLAVLGFGGMATMRQGVSKTGQADKPGRQPIDASASRPGGLRTAAAWLVLAALAAGLLAGSGCASTGSKVLSSTALTVDAAMRGWAVWTVQGQADAEDEAAVRAAYIQYQLAMQAAESAYLAAVSSGDKDIWDQAKAGLEAARESLLLLIGTFQRTETQ